jgi:hypothetical protein
MHQERALAQKSLSKVSLSMVPSKAVFGPYFGGKKIFSADFGTKNTTFEAMQPFIVLSESF